MPLWSRKRPDAKISEIAAAAGVNDSVIYHYFKDKEDLMFYTVGAYVKSTTDAYIEQMKAVRDPVSRLRKLIWDQLHYHHINPNYTKYTLFYCRSKKIFFRHESFFYFVRWVHLLRDILKDGVNEKIFSANLPVTVANDMILGYMDMESIHFFVGLQSRPTEKDFNEIIDMFMFLLTDDRQIPEPEIAKRERILTMAEAMFAEKDYHKVTTAEIAKAVQVSEATLYELFANKEDILMSGLQHRLKGHVRVAENFFDIRTPLSRLVRFIYYYFTMHIRQPAFVKNFILNGIYNENFYKSSAYRDFEGYMAILDQILKDGKEDGTMRPDLDIRRFRYLLMGVFSHTVLRWFFAEETKKLEMMGRINEITALLMKMVLKPGQTVLSDYR